MSAATIVVDHQHPDGPAKSRGRRNMSTAEAVICQICNKLFSRKDVLTRHIKMKHQDPLVPKLRKRSRRTSCLRCAFYKIKCVGRPTCQQCDKSAIVCQFNFSVKPGKGSQPLTATAEEESERSPSTSGSVEEVLRGPEQLLENMTQETLGNEFGSVACHDESNSEDARMAGKSPGPVGCLGSPPAQSSAQKAVHASVPDNPFEIFLQDQTFTGQFLFDPMDFTSSNTVLDFEAAFPIIQDDDFDLNALLNSDGSFSATPKVLQHNLSNLNDLDNGRVLGAEKNSAAPDHGPAKGSSENISALTQSQKEPLTPLRRQSWSFMDLDKEVTARSEASQNATLSTDNTHSPRLSDMLNDTLQGTLLDSMSQKSIISSIYHALKLPIGHHHIQEVPEISEEEASIFWNLYFDQFHQTFPVLHKGSMELGQCPPLLLAAITAIGASFAQTPTAEEYSVRVIGRLCALLSRTNTEAPIKTPMVGLLTRCLTYYHIVSSGLQTFFDSVIVSQVHMIPEVRKLSLFSSSDSTLNVICADLPLKRIGNISRAVSVKRLLESDEEDEELAIQWYAWIQQEQQKRITWGVTALHYRCCSMFHTSSIIREAELNIYLPCSETLWQAETVSQWRAHFPYTDRPPRNLPFLGVINRLISDNSMLRDIPVLSRLAVVNIVKLKQGS